MASEKGEQKRIKEAVRERYADLARSASFKNVIAVIPSEQKGCCSPRSTSEGLERARRLYGEEDIAALPEGAIAATAGCGNPVALAELKEGQTVLDLGSGGGIDCLLAARRVGATGRVIGLDMTPEMIALAQRNAKEVGAQNVEFRLGEMERMPVDSASVDVVISNCVICLSPDKDAVFAEAYRVLKPGGRVLISDIVTTGDIPAEVRASMDEWSRCIAGALSKEDYLARIRATGFRDMRVLLQTQISNPTGWRASMASIKVRAVKP